MSDLRVHNCSSFESFKKSLVIKLFAFFVQVGISSPSKSAFIQRRKLIKAEFFKDFFLLTAHIIQKQFPLTRWKGLRLIGIDGIALKLSDFDWVGDEFRWHVNHTATVASTRLLVFFDVLYKLIKAMMIITQDIEHNALTKNDAIHIRLTAIWRRLGQKIGTITLS